MYRKRDGFLKTIGMIIVTTLISSFVVLKFFEADYNGRIKDLENQTETKQLSQVEQQQVTIEPVLDDTPSVTKKIISAVVGVSSGAPNENIIFGSENESYSVGSGVIVSQDGYILTNYHVITSKNISVNLANGKVEAAELKWFDKVLDIAVIKINQTGLNYAKLGDDKKLEVGETVLAVGNPLGMQFQRTVTKGIVSALNRTISVDVDGKSNYMEGLIQTDASINPGNSGGPLINIKGEVVGINTVKVASAEGIGFAVPINVCKPVIQSFNYKGEFKTPYIGVFAYDKDITEYLTQTKINGMYVAKIDISGPAYSSGLAAGDILTHFNGVEITTMLQLREALFACEIGQTYKIRFVRKEKMNEIDITIVNSPNTNTVTR